MKKLLFQKFISDTFKFFIIISLSIGLIVWVIQAVGFLDFVTEDGHGLLIYFSYTLLNFPKIIHRILPFVFFISLFLFLPTLQFYNNILTESLSYAFSLFCVSFVFKLIFNYNSLDELDKICEFIYAR